MKLDLQLFAKTKSVSTSGSSSHSSSSTSSSSSSKSNTNSKSKETSKAVKTGTSKSNTTGSSKSNTSGWQNGTSVTRNTTVKSDATLAAEQAWKDKSNYTASDKVNQAYLAKKNAENAYQNYGDYKSKYGDALDGLVNKILNRERFSYDFNADPLYQQYKDQYKNQGKEAMLDTQAAASALTGGYGSSYATTAGSQAYQQYLKQADDKIPELYQLALDKYDRETQQLNDQYSMVGSQEDRDYNRYNQGKQDLLNAMNYYQGDYSNESSNDLSRWQTESSNAAALAKYLYDQDYTTTTETTSQNGSTTKENSKSTTNTKDKDVTKTTGVTVGSSKTNERSNSASSTSSNSSSSSYNSSTSQPTLLRDVDQEEVNAVKNYVDQGDAGKASNYIKSMIASGKYTDKQIQAVLDMAGLARKDVEKKK